MLRYILEDCPRASPRPENTSPGVQEQLLSHRTDGIEIWSDTVYMGPPFLAASAAFYADTQSRALADVYTPPMLLEASLRQVIMAAEVLQSPSGEWSHVYDLTTHRSKRPAFWGVGNGWVCGGIVRIINTIIFSDALYGFVTSSNPDTHGKLRTTLHHVYDILLRTLCACLAHMQPESGLFHNVLDDPSSFVETNLSQMLAYTLFRLVDLHLHSLRFNTLGFSPIDRGELASWEKLGEVMREAAIGKTDEWGFVRDVCGSPTFDHPGTATEGQAWAVLMEVARAELLTHRHCSDT